MGETQGPFPWGILLLWAALIAAAVSAGWALFHLLLHII